MIIDQKVKVKITKRNIEHYLPFYPDIKLKDVIDVFVENELMKGSNQKINVRCDLCETDRNINFQMYNRNINSCPEYPIYTCDKCSHLKIKEFNKKKYGTEYYSQTKEYTNRFKSTMLERYGVEYTMQSDELKNKAIKTNIERFGLENIFMDKDLIKSKFKDKYGKDHPSQVDEFKCKRKNTFLERYGVEYTMQSEELKNKAIKTIKERYGTDSYSKTQEFIERVKKTNIKRYGVEWGLKSSIIRDKSKITMLNNYGVDNISKSDFIRKNSIIFNDKDYVRYIGDEISLFNCDNGHKFEINVSRYHSRLKNKIPLCTICNPIGTSRSIKEDELYLFIKQNYKGEIIQSYRDKYEIDIYVPELKIGFEFNGIWWHSDLYRDKNYHYDKTNFFNSRGIRIFHIWEDDWISKNDIIKSMILNLLFKCPKKIYARKCRVSVVRESSDFLDLNHKQGRDISNIKIGLFQNNEMVSIMTFNKFEGRKKLPNGEWNLSRFCNKIGMNVVGGASKLLNFFIKNFNPTRIISYADRDWSQGGLYDKLNFKNLSESGPDYKYVIGEVRRHKQNFKKSKLQLENKTEKQYMEEKGYPRIWDCGKIKFEIII